MPFSVVRGDWEIEWEHNHWIRLWKNIFFHDASSGILKNPASVFFSKTLKTEFASIFFGFHNNQVLPRLMGHELMQEACLPA